MGAIVHNAGVAFRVWAPHAQFVFVKGDFNGWSDDATQLTHEENGYWYADVDAAPPGQEYKFVLINACVRISIGPNSMLVFSQDTSWKSNRASPGYLQ